MCRRHIERASAGYRSIALISEQEARLSKDLVLVIDVLCTNVSCFFRLETAWEITSYRRVGHTCGSWACLTHNRCCLISLPSVEEAGWENKRRRYVLDETSVFQQTGNKQHGHHHHGVD